MAWRTILSSETDPGAPVTSELMKALADNPEAIATGASGAPRVTDAGLSATATNTGRDWVLARTALATTGAVGTYAFLFLQTTGTDIDPGDIISASSLFYAGINLSSSSTSVSWENITGSAQPSGSWQAMSGVGGITGNYSATLFLRVA